jgi:CRP-like cAMP-binding protein
MLNALRSHPGGRTGPLEARLQSYAPLKPSDLEVLRACGEDLKNAPSGSDILSASDGEHCRVIVSGWAASARSLRDGRRQVLQIFLPGDVLGISRFGSDGVVALSNVATTDARPLASALGARDPAHLTLWQAWERAQTARHQQLLDQVLRLGRLSAYERTAHLLLELMDRHRRAGLSDGQRMPWPLTQETLADVLGLSVVHVNRILQQLRREGLILLRAGQLATPDPARLAAAAVWDG